MGLGWFERRERFERVVGVEGERGCVVSGEVGEEQAKGRGEKRAGVIFVSVVRDGRWVY